MEIQRQKTSVALLSVASNTVLVTLKLITGLLTGSISVLSEAAHSSMDLIASIIAFFAVRISARRPDAEHPFGHGKVEDISALAEALLIVIAAIWIVVEAIHKIIAPQPLATVDWGIAVMLFSVVANIVVSQLLFIVGKRTDSPALIADAWHLRTDVWTSAGVLAGLAIIWVGARLWPEVNLNWIDPTAAIVVAILIFRAALELTITAIKDLIDTSPPAHELYWLSGSGELVSHGEVNSPHQDTEIRRRALYRPAHSGRPGHDGQRFSCNNRENDRGSQGKIERRRPDGAYRALRRPL
jgi:cation diffusion facilitator family transporter